MTIPQNIQQLFQKLILALKTIPELSITVTTNHINYTQTEVVTNLAPKSRKYYPYKKNTRSYSGIYLPELLKLALRENLMLTSISILPNTTIQQKIQLCLNEESTEYPSIYRYFHIGKTLYEQKLELTTANLTKKSIQKQSHNKFKTTARPTNSYYKLRAALRLYDLFHTYENVLQNPILQPLKIQYIGKLTELKFQQFSDQISSIILDYYLKITDSTWTSMELSLEKKALIVYPVSFGGKTWAQIASSSFSCAVLSDFFSIGLFSGVKPVLLVSNSLGDSCLLLVDQISGIMKKLSFVGLVPLASKSYVSFLVVFAPVASNLDSEMALDNTLASPPFSLLVVVTNLVANLSSSSSKVLTTKVGRLESKMVALKMSVEAVLKRLDCLCSGLGFINVSAKQKDIICWHRDSGNLVSIITETKLRFSNESWIKDKFNGVRVFSSGLDKGFLGAGVAIIMNISLARHICKVSEVPGQLLSVKLLFKNKLSANDINSVIAKAVNKLSFVVLDDNFNEDSSQRYVSFKKCLDLGLGMTKTIDFLFIFSNLVNTVVDHKVSDVGEFFNTDYWAVLYNFKGATLANAVMFSNKFATSMKFSDLDAIWNTIYKIIFKNFDDVFTKKFLRFYKLELLVSKIALVIQDIVSFGADSDHVCSALFSVRKSYHAAKLAKSLKAKETNIRLAINRRMKSFEVNKSHTIRNVLECPFHKMALDHLVVDNELILEPDLVKFKMNVIMESWTRKCKYVFDKAFFGVMCLIKFDELVDVVSDLLDGKAAGLLVLDMFLVLLNSCLFSESVPSSWKEAWVLIILKSYKLKGILINTHPIALIKTTYKIFSKILSDRISLACSIFDVLCGDNFLVLKSTLIQSPIFAISLVIKNALEKDQKLWLVLQNMWKAYNSKSLVIIKMCSKFICFFSGIHRDHTNRVITDFGLTDDYCVHNSLDQGEESVCEYRLNSHFIFKYSRAETRAELFSFFTAGTFVDDTIWVGSSQRATKHILDASDLSLSISDLLISIAKKSESHQYLGIFFSTEDLSKLSLAKANSDTCFFTNLVLRKAISDKQLLYLVLAVFHSIVSYRTQFSFVPVGVCNKWDALIHKGLKLKSGLLLDFSSDTIYHPSFYGLKSFCPVHLLNFFVYVHVSASNNFLADMVRILLDCNLSLSSFLANSFQFNDGTLMFAVLGKSRFLKFLPFLYRYGVAFVDQLWNSSGARLDFRGPIPEWFKISVVFLSGLALSSAYLLDLSGIGCQNILESEDYELGTVGCKVSTAAFFENINLGLGVDISGLMLLAMAELQAIVLALECVSVSSSVHLFSDSQSALDACKLELSLMCSDFHNNHSGILGNEQTDVIAGAAFFSSWCLSSHLDEHFIVADNSVVSDNSRHFVHDIYCSICCTCWEIGFGSKFLIFTSRLLANTYTYYMKALHYRLLVAVQKRLYNRFYSSVLCLYCGNVEVSDYVFSSVSGFSHSFSGVLQLLSFCGSDSPVFMALCKGFVFSGWYHKAVSVFYNSKIACLEVVKFVCSFGLAFREDVWSVYAKHQAYMERNELILLDGLAFILVSGLTLRFFAGVVKLLGVTDAFGVQFGFCKPCLFFWV
ncbi:hypothetical protein G9A89_012226 [Geosiphon pyriformis]|nr:hypothetical protein G9A89_012226 [Geosiphon pyriformis]